MKITAITTACYRPEAFRLCEGYMSRQTVKPVQWLVLDDDEKKTECTAGQEYHYWPEMRGRRSLSKKIGRAITDGLIKGDAIVFWENDDFYADDAIEFFAKGLADYQLVGEGRALYYNVEQRFWFEHVNMTHASLCATAIRRDLFEWLDFQCRTSECPFLDVRLWNRTPGTHKVFDPYTSSSRRRRSVGIKAMPGRSGYGGGHRGRDKSAVSDFNLNKLRSLIGKDADSYAPYFKPTAPPLPPERNGFIAPPKVRQVAPRVKNYMENHIAHTETGRVHGPNWLKWLAPFAGKPNVAGLEVGTFEGNSAEWMLDNIFTDPSSRYHCIDPFTGSIEHKVANINTANLEQSARARLSRFPNVEIHVGFSQHVLRDLKAKVVCTYIDGDHTARATLRDAVLSFDLLEVGGIMIFDDLSWAVFPNELDRPKLGIECFLKAYARQITVIQAHGAQAVIRKKSE